jgi:tetratricopeptide (TPR) repeat protein
LQNLELARAVGDWFTMGIALLNLGEDASVQDNEQKATAYFEGGLHIFRELGEKRMVSYSLGDLGSSFYYQGDFSKAQALLEESLSIQRRAFLSCSRPASQESLRALKSALRKLRPEASSLWSCQNR